MLSMQHEPQRLAEYGYVTRILRNVEVIIPPLCPVPAGEFLMGSDPKEDLYAIFDERPQRCVALAAFAILRFPVTVAEYECFTRSGGDAPEDQEAQWRAPDHPETHITWREAVDYARWLSELTGQVWRLPTEAEWEKAARWDPEQRRSRIFPWGDTFDTSRCTTLESGVGATTALGTYPTGASPCGAEDMAGNIWEWTSTIPRGYPYTPHDGREAPNEFARHVLRGGSFAARARQARCAGRYAHVTGGSLADVGFRLVCDVAE